MQDYKHTLNLPHTEFAMKANLPKKEPAILTMWEDIRVYNLISDQNERPKFILHDGPPYANGDIHIGHVLNKTLKDIIVRYKTMQGFYAPFVPGWDCHGLPVEHQLFKELGISKSDISQLEFRKKARSYALKYVEIQKTQFKRLGVLGDWDNPYLTLEPKYVAQILRYFGKLVKAGYIYRGLKPVNWCFKCETALAEAEVEYENYTSPSIYVKFEILNLKNAKKLNLPLQKKVYAIIWTTTPWTLLSNLAISVHPDFKYSFVELKDEIWLMAYDLVKQTMEKLGVKEYKIVNSILGRELEYSTYRDIFKRDSNLIFVLANYVSKEEGTGCVHTAPGHGQEDYITGQKYRLNTVMPVDSKGRFNSDIAQSFKGMHVFEASKLIIERLRNDNALLYSDNISHSYPHCWRCKTPVIFRATKQWFLNIDHKQLRRKILKIIKNVRFKPLQGKNRFSAMLENRPDWCLSRQRYWGVPIPVVYCSHCKEWIADEKIILHFADIVESEGVDAWFSRPLKEILPEKFFCPSCKNKDLAKGSDIIDVWFDSGVSFAAVLKKRKALGFPSDLYLEGSDQHRGWFQSSLIPSVAIEKKPPFKYILTHGFVVDGYGRKMSKSLGNVVAPNEVIDKYGADILRLWVASSDYNEDIRISEEILNRLIDAYRKIRNTARFLLGALSDFNPDIDKIAYKKLPFIDKLALYKFESLLRVAKNAYDNFDFYKVFRAIYRFCIDDMSSFYLDVLKDRLYTFGKNSLGRRCAQSTIYEILFGLTRIIAPVLVFTSEEIWSFFPKEKDYKNFKSIHLLNWPKEEPCRLNKTIEKQSEYLLTSLRPAVLKALEEKRSEGKIRSSLEAKILLLTNNDFRLNYLKGLKEELAAVFIVSQVDIGKVSDIKGLSSTAINDLSVVVEKAEGKKCMRCWNYSKSVGEDSGHPNICKRCVTNLTTESQRRRI